MTWNQNKGTLIKAEADEKILRFKNRFKLWYKMNKMEFGEVHRVRIIMRLKDHAVQTAGFLDKETDT